MIAMISDIHIGHKIKGIETSWKWQKPILLWCINKIAASSVIKQIFILGDVVEYPGEMHPETAEKMVWFGEMLSKSCPNMDIHVIPGNHDCIYHKVDIATNWVSLLWGDRFPNIKVHVEPTIIHTGKKMDKKIHLFPWMSDTDNFKRLLLTSQASIVMGHCDVKGMKYGPRTIDSDSGLDPIDLSRFSNVFLGHFHMFQTNDPVTYVGSPFALNRGDIGDGCKHGFVTYDPDNQTIHHVTHDIQPFETIEFEDRLYTNEELKHLRDKMVYINMSNPTPQFRALFREQINQIVAGYDENMTLRSNKSPNSGIQESSLSDVSVNKGCNLTPEQREKRIVESLLSGTDVDVESVLDKFEKVRMQN